MEAKMSDKTRRTVEDLLKVVDKLLTAAEDFEVQERLLGLSLDPMDEKWLDDIERTSQIVAIERELLVKARDLLENARYETGR